MKKKSVWNNPWFYFVWFNVIWIFVVFSMGYSNDPSDSAFQVTQVATQAIFSLLKTFCEWVMCDALFLIIFYLIRSTATKEEKAAADAQVRDYLG